MLLDDGSVGGRQRRHLAVRHVRHAEAAADVEMLELVPVGEQLFGQLAHQPEGVAERLEIA